MRVRATFEYSGSLVLPVHYNYAVQAVIYKYLTPNFRKFLHDDGFNIGGRKFKLFTFSKLFGKFERRQGNLVYTGPIKLWVGSPLEQFVREFVNGLLKSGSVTLLGHELTVSSIELPETPKIEDQLICKTLAPITVYSTLFTADGRKKTYYYTPYEEEFSELVAANLRKKASLISGNQVSGDVSIKPASRPKEVVCIFKNTVVRGWEGVFKLVGDQLLLQTAYEAGVGSKNSGGFGMVEVVNNA